MKPRTMVLLEALIEALSMPDITGMDDLAVFLDMRLSVYEGGSKRPIAPIPDAQ